MKRTPLLISFFIILLTVGGIWIYQSTHKKKITPWDLIGNDAVMVFELNSFDALKQKLDNMQAIKNVIGSNDDLNRVIKSKFLQGSKTLLSVHPIAKDDFGFVVYAEVKSLGKETNLLEFSEALQNELSLKKRLYNGVEIYEFLKRNKPVFSFAVVEEVVLMSGSSFLLEGALRLRSSEGAGLFKISNAPLFRLPTLQSDEGNVYIDVSNFIESTKLFLLPDPARSRFSLLGNSLADFKVSDGRILMNGFVLNSDDDILTLFKEQKPQSIDIEPLVSNRVATIMHFGISDFDRWVEDQKVFLKKRGVSSVDSLEQELLKLSVNIASVRKSIGNQFANCYLSREESIVNIIKLNKEGDQVSVFDELSSKISSQKRDTLYLESYAGYQIKLIDYKNFLYQLFYPLAPQADQCFFVQIGQYLILSENVELIKYFIDDIDNENTWGKSVEWNKFFSSSLQESNLNLFFDGKLLSVLLRDQFNAKWRPFFDSTYFLGIDKGSAQLSRLESNFYLNASLQFSRQQTKKVNSSLVKITNDFGNLIALPVKLVKSHISKNFEVMMQDSLNNLYLLSNDLKLQWKKPITKRIEGNIDQLDFFGNGKLQYFFTTENGIHLIDRLGRNVHGFPLELKHGGIEYSSVVDYDRSKKYRYLMTNETGDLLLSDKNGNLLEGWNPRSLNGKMLKSAKHIRVLGKDYIIAIQHNGTVNLLNRRGEMVRGFPIDLGLRPVGDFFITVGNAPSLTYFTVISGDGLMVEFGLDGQIRKREVLLKRINSSQFSLVKSIEGDSYVFLRVDPSKLTIVDSDGRTLFEVENSGSTTWRLTYLENRLKERYYSLYDQQQNFSYFYNSNGELLLPQPLESTQLPTMYFDEKLKSLSIYNAFNSKLNLVSIKK